jgi:lactoylglutathione lyase
MKNILFGGLLACLALTVASTTATAQTKKPLLNHLALSVKNLAKSTAFYKDIIQIDTIPEPFHDGRHTWFKIAEHSHLHLIQYDDGIVVPAKGTHLCFSVASIEEVIKRLNKNNMTWGNWNGEKSAITKRVDGVQQIYFQDPDGYWIEINDDKY